jgi:hypothetical protein
MLSLLLVSLLLQTAGEDSSRASEAKRSVRLPPSSRARQEMVVTNQNLAVVTETRHVELPDGRLVLLWEGLPPSVRTETWSLTNAQEAGLVLRGVTSPTSGGSPETDPRAFLSSLRGKKVQIERPGGQKVEAEIVAVYGPTPDLILFREAAELVYGEPDARIRLSGGDSPAASAVALDLQSERAAGRAVTARYLVSDLTWDADYSLSLSPDEKSGRLDGWFTVDNRTGAEFLPQRLRLLAGVLRAAPGPHRTMIAMRQDAAAQAGIAEGVPLSESRVYEISGAAAIPPGRTLLPLAVDTAVQVTKSHIVRSTYWMGTNEEPQRIPVAVAYRIGTKPLKRAIPSGTVRVYADSGTVFAGEDRIEHTPEGNDLDVEVSEAFDLMARRAQTRYQQLGRFETESTVEITLANRKKEPVTLLVRESFPGDWTITSSSIPARKKSASVAEFPVPVAAGGEAKLVYTVRVKVGG